MPSARAKPSASDVTVALKQGHPGQLAAIGYIIIGIIIVAFLAGYLLLHFGFKIDEDMEKKIVAELAARHQADELNAAKGIFPEASVPAESASSGH
jgi:Na+/melibiose symporter-like transporter